MRRSMYIEAKNESMSDSLIMSYGNAVKTNHQQTIRSTVNCGKI